MFPGAFLALVCVLSVATAQPLPESVFKQLSAQELRVLELAQNPKLLELAARTGERVVVNIAGPSQGSVVQDGVNVVLNCLPWLMNFPGGSIRWYFSKYDGVDHTSLGPRMPQNRQDLLTNPIRKITGEFDEIYNITRTRIQQNAADPGRGIYECEVCIQRGTIFEQCHSANTSLIIAGRKPLLNSTTGRTPDMDENGNKEFRIGSTICIEIDPVDPNRIFQLDVALVCPITDESVDNNIPPAVPVPSRLWTHTNLNGTTASLPLEEAGVSPMVTTEFKDTFPGIENRMIVDTQPPSDTIIFSVGNVVKNASSTAYQDLRQSFGEWTCTVNNSLGIESATTFFSDMCGMAGIPSILQGNCEEAGTLIDNRLAQVQRGQPSSIPIGCDVCVKEAEEIWLTIVCPTNAASLPNVTVVISWRDENGNELKGDEDTLLVQTPGRYTCIADFGDGNVVSESTDIGFLPNVDITVKLNGATDRGCNRLRNNTFTSSDVCAFLNENLEISCDPGLENVAGFVQPVGINPFVTMVQSGDEANYFCSASTNASDRCISITGDRVTLRVFDPAKITSPKAECSSANNAGQKYGLNTVNTGGQVILCCAVSGRPEPKTTWSRIVTDPRTGLTTEMVLPGGDTNINFDNSTNTLTFTTYNSTDDGTYICRTSNIAGVDAGTVSLSSQADSAIWVTSKWSECEPKCRNGSRTRDVSCRNSLNNRVRPNGDCDCNNIPAEIELCINVPDLPECFMVPLWKTGDFGRCSKGCAGGYKTRSVECAIPFDGTVVPDDFCREIYGYMPLGIDFCYNRCCYQDVYPRYCYHHAKNRCKEPIYQQNCCWTCGRANLP